MVTHILTAMFRIGLFDHPTPDPATRQGHERQHPGAPRAVRPRSPTEGTVLLKNAGALLPLSTSTRAVDRRHRRRGQENPQTAAGGSATVLPSAPVVTPLAGITARAGSGTTSPTRRARSGHRPAARRPGRRLRQRPHRDLLRHSDLTGPPIATGTVPNLDYHRQPRRGRPAHRLVGPLHRHDHRAGRPATTGSRCPAGGYVQRLDRRHAGRQPSRRCSSPTQNGLIHLTAGAHCIRVEVTPFQATLVTVDAFAVTPGLHLRLAAPGEPAVDAGRRGRPRRRRRRRRGVRAGQRGHGPQHRSRCPPTRTS